MMRIQFVVARGCFAIVTLTISIATAVAQSGKLPNPADPNAAAPAVKHDSVFSDYQPFSEQKIRSWQEVNQEVADNPGMGSMGSMKDMPGMAMPGKDSKAGNVPKSKDGAAGHDMGSMQDMPGMDSKTGNAPKSKEGAASHNMGSMKGMPGMDSKTGNAPKSKEGAAGHNMGSLKDMPGKTMAGMDSKAGNAPKSKEGAAGHNMASTEDMPGMNKQAASAPIGKEDHGAMAMAKPQTAPGQPGNARTTNVTGTGVVQGIDKANGKVKLTHDPIEALGWPKMTMFFRLKDSSLADHVKEGDKVEFSLEQSASGYVISSLKKGAASHDMKQMK